MEARMFKVYAKADPAVALKVIPGHFATNHSHINYYIDLTTLKARQNEAQAAARLLAYYSNYSIVDTIVCLDGSEVIGAFLARHLAKKEVFSVNSNKNINVVTPEYDSNGQLIFRDNLTPMIVGREVLILISTVNSGKSARRTLECVQYYGGKVQGIAAIFSMLEQVDGIPVYSLFSPDDIAGYISSSPKECPMCRAGQKIDALANSFGLSML